MNSYSGHMQVQMYNTLNKEEGIVRIRPDRKTTEGWVKLSSNFRTIYLSLKDYNKVKALNTMAELSAYIDNLKPVHRKDHL